MARRPVHQFGAVRRGTSTAPERLTARSRRLFGRLGVFSLVSAGTARVRLPQTRAACEEVPRSSRTTVWGVPIRSCNRGVRPSTSGAGRGRADPHRNRVFGGEFAHRRAWSNQAGWRRGSRRSQRLTGVGPRRRLGQGGSSFVGEVRPRSTAAEPVAGVAALAGAAGDGQGAQLGDGARFGIRGGDDGRGSGRDCGRGDVAGAGEGVPGWSTVRARFASWRVRRK